MPGLEDIKKTVKSILSETKAFFRHFQWKEAFIFLGFVLLSFCFLVLLSMNDEREIETTIPIRYKNIPSNLTISNESPTFIKVRIKDRGSVLLNYSFNKTFSPIEINVKDVADPDTNEVVVFTPNNIQTYISKRLISTTTLSAINPDQIRLRYNPLASKEVPVIFNGEIQTQAGFLVSSDIQIDPATVTIYGDQAALDSIKEIKTAFISLKKANKNASRTASLLAPESVSPSAKQVTIQIPIEEFTEKSFEIPIQSSGIPADYVLRLFPSKVTVSANVPLSRYVDLTEDGFKIEISFADIRDNKSGVIPLTFAAKPDWVYDAAITPNEVEFILEQVVVDAP